MYVRYFLLDIDAPPANLLTLRQKLKVDEDVVRVNIIKPRVK